MVGGRTSQREAGLAALLFLDNAATCCRPSDAGWDEYAANAMRNTGKNNSGRTKRNTSSAGPLFWVAENARARCDRGIFPFVGNLQHRQLAKTPGFGATLPPRQNPINVNGREIAKQKIRSVPKMHRHQKAKTTEREQY